MKHYKKTKRRQKKSRLSQNKRSIQKLKKTKQNKPLGRHFKKTRQNKSSRYRKIRGGGDSDDDDESIVKSSPTKMSSENVEMIFYFIPNTNPTNDDKSLVGSLVLELPKKKEMVGGLHHGAQLCADFNSYLHMTPTQTYDALLDRFLGNSHESQQLRANLEQRINASDRLRQVTIANLTVPKNSFHANIPPVSDLVAEVRDSPTGFYVNLRIDAGPPVPRQQVAHSSVHPYNLADPSGPFHVVNDANPTHIFKRSGVKVLFKLCGYSTCVPFDAETIVWSIGTAVDHVNGGLTVQPAGLVLLEVISNYVTHAIFHTNDDYHSTVLANPGLDTDLKREIARRLENVCSDVNLDDRKFIIPGSYEINQSEDNLKRIKRDLAVGKVYGNRYKRNPPYPIRFDPDGVNSYASHAKWEVRGIPNFPGKQEFQPRIT